MITAKALNDMERRAATAESVELPAATVVDLIAAARNGMRPVGVVAEDVGESGKTRRIPVAEAARVAKKYGYDQIVIYARKTGEGGGEHMTTYGRTKAHCGVAARVGETLRRFMGWAP